MQITRHTLANGLRVMVLELPHVHSIELGLFVKAGPRFETPADQGIAHFAEHMFFRGTRSLPGTFGLHAEVERLGTPINALTSRDYCQYHFAVPRRNLARAAELFSEIMLYPSFEDIEVERRIVLEEFQGDLNENDEDINLENHSRAMLWPDSPLGRNILGTEANIRRFSRAGLFQHHERYYVGRNSLLYFSGAIRAEDAIELAERHFVRFPAGEELPVPRVERSIRGPQFRFIEQQDSQDHMNLGFVAPSYMADSYPAMVILQNILTDGISSRLQWNLCERLGLVYDLDAGLESFFDTGVFDVDTSASHGKLPGLLREVIRILADLRDQPVSDAELARAKDRYRMMLEFAEDSPGYMASWQAATELFQPAPAPELCLARVEALSVDDIQAVARTVFDRSNAALVVAGHLSKNDRKNLQKLIDDAWT